MTKSPPPQSQVNIHQSQRDPIVAAFGPDENRLQDFGVRVEGAHESLDHSYRIRNDSSEPIRLVRGVNLKPCCGRIAFEPTELAPGEATQLDVTLVLGAAVGRIVHSARVETEPPSLGPLEFQTSATVRPRLRIEPIGDTSARSTTLLPNETKRLAFRAIGLGTDEYPPPALGDDDLESDLVVRWTNAPTERTTEVGLIERARSFEVELPPVSDHGHRAASLQLGDANDKIVSQSLQWKVVAAVRVDPPGLIVESDSTTETRFVNVLSHDGTPFQILSTESDLPGIEVEVSSRTKEPLHRLQVRLLPTSDNVGRPGRLTVKTDHPLQPTVHIALLINRNEASRDDGQEADQ